MSFCGFQSLRRARIYVEMDGWMDGSGQARTHATKGEGEGAGTPTKIPVEDNARTHPPRKSDSCVQCPKNEVDESPVEDDAGVGRGEVDAHAAGLGGEEHDEGAGARLVVVVDRRLGVKGR